MAKNTELYNQDISSRPMWCFLAFKPELELKSVGTRNKPMKLGSQAGNQCFSLTVGPMPTSPNPQNIRVIFTLDLVNKEVLCGPASHAERCVVAVTSAQEYRE